MPDDDDRVMKGAQVGGIIRKPTAAPPWIVVDRSIAGLTVARWPGRLLEVEILEPSTEQAGPRATYTRCVAVRVNAELPVSSLFGPRGTEVLKVIERARRLSQDDVELLSRQYVVEHQSMYSAAWNTWLAPLAPDSIHLGHSHFNTLAIYTGHKLEKVEVGYSVSPIGAGLLVISRIIYDRASKILGDAAFTIDEDGDECLDQRWSKARDVVCCAAMAVGAPELFSESDAAGILESWRVLPNS